MKYLKGKSPEAQTWELGPNYAIKPTPEQALGSNRALPPARLIAALDFVGCVSFVVIAHRGLVARLPQRCARRNELEAAGSVRSRARWRAVGPHGSRVVAELAKNL